MWTNWPKSGSATASAAGVAVVALALVALALVALALGCHWPSESDVVDVVTLVVDDDGAVMNGTCTGALTLTTAKRLPSTHTTNTGER